VRYAHLCPHIRIDADQVFDFSFSFSTSPLFSLNLPLASLQSPPCFTSTSPLLSDPHRLTGQRNRRRHVGACSHHPHRRRSFDQAPARRKPLAPHSRRWKVQRVRGSTPRYYLRSGAFSALLTNFRPSSPLPHLNPVSMQSLPSLLTQSCTTGHPHLRRQRRRGNRPYPPRRPH
jgi:hypothetical protein